MPGLGQYQAGDPRWAESLLQYYQTALLIDTGRRPINFPTHKSGIDPMQKLVGKPAITIAIVGDWGSGNIEGRPSPAAAIAGHIKAHNPDYTIHLGDVYYAGLAEEERDNFLKQWPQGAAGTYTLNSNHEMYCGGVGYFDVVLADPKFAAQQRLSYFALNNENWLIIGLDTAFFGYRQSLLYEQGTLSDSRERNGTVQVEWLSEVLREHAGKRVILLTHHDGFDVDPITGAVATKPLYQMVMQQLKDVRDFFWYWGHVHTAIVYEQIMLNRTSTFSARCVGHGAIPYVGFPKELSRLGQGDVKVRWAETRPDPPQRAFNGFLLLTLKGADLTEEFYDELGNQCWSNV